MIMATQDLHIVQVNSRLQTPEYMNEPCHYLPDCLRWCVRRTGMLFMLLEEVTHRMRGDTPKITPSSIPHVARREWYTPRQH